jgi:hypothetical protein
LYTTFQPTIKATRRVAAGWNVGEGGVGVKRPSRLNPEPPKGGEAYTSGYVPVGLKRIIAIVTKNSKPSVPPCHSSLRLKVVRLGVGILRPAPHGASFCDCWRRTAMGGKGSCYRNNDKGVFALFLGFVFLRQCRGKGGVRISPLFPCPRPPGRRAGCEYRLCRKRQRKKGGIYELQKLRSVSGAILSYFLLPFLFTVCSFWSSFPVRAQPEPPKAVIFQSKINLEVKNGFRRAFMGVDVKRYGKGDKDGSTGFYERFRGFFIGGLEV